MSLNTKILMSLLAGTFAALLGWMVIDFNPWYRMPQSFADVSLYQAVRDQMMITMVFGCFMGAALGIVNGMFSASGRMTQRYVAWGLVIGAIGGFLGLYFGQLFFGPLYNVAERMSTVFATKPLAFILQVLARAIGWSLIGFFVGFVQGLPINSKRAMRHGAIGGLIGGLLGGTMFELTGYILPPGTPHTDVIARGLGLTATGAAIGFFIGLVETLLKQAWVRVIQGRNEGREHIISKPQTVIGRNELADIPLFGDPNIAPAHAVIEQQAGRHILHDTGSPVGTSVNGQPAKMAQLKDGDIIQIASMRLEFHEKATASKLAPPPVDVARAQQPSIPTMEGVCPYCGTKKNASGQCACSVGAGSPGGQDPSPALPATGREPLSGMGREPLSGAGMEPFSAVDRESFSAMGPGSAVGPEVAPSPLRGGLGRGGPRLVGLSGPYAGQVFDLSSPVVSIGREPGKDVQLANDSTVSRNHASIRNENGVFTVHDEGSSNGTAVNGMRITSQPLAPGDTVQFGGSAFRFEA